MSIEFLKTDFDKVSYLVNVLTARATGMAPDSKEYEVLRKELLSNEKLVQAYLYGYDSIGTSIPFGVSSSLNSLHMLNVVHTFPSNLQNY